MDKKRKLGYSDESAEVKPYKLGKTVKYSEWIIKSDAVHQGYFSLISSANEDLRLAAGRKLTV